MKKLGLGLVEGNVHIGQQARSQVLNSISKIAVYDLQDEIKEKELQILQDCNLQSTNSIEFLDRCRERLLELWNQHDDEGEESENENSSVDSASNITDNLDNVMKSAERELLKRKRTAPEI